MGKQALCLFTKCTAFHIPTSIILTSTYTRLNNIITMATIYIQTIIIQLNLKFRPSYRYRAYKQHETPRHRAYKLHENPRYTVQRMFLLLVLQFECGFERTKCGFKHTLSWGEILWYCYNVNQGGSNINEQDSILIGSANFFTSHTKMNAYAKFGTFVHCI